MSTLMVTYVYGPYDRTPIHFWSSDAVFIGRPPVTIVPLPVRPPVTQKRTLSCPQKVRSDSFTVLANEF